MKMKKIVKIASIVLMISMLLMAISPVVFSASSGVNPQNYKGDSGYDTTSIDTIGNQIIRIVSVIGAVVSVVVLVVLGIKYMMGSAEEKAEYKKTLLPYVIGAALVFAASAIATIIFNFTQNLG